MIFTNIELLQAEIEKHKSEGKKIVWTNGCFDIMHPGHIEGFRQAKALGDILIVGLNGDQSPYWKEKPGRPVNDQNFRAEMLKAIRFIDYVYIFQDERPDGPVGMLLPHVMVKGGDYTVEQIAGAKEVIANGGEVVLVPIVEGYSTTAIVNKIKQL